MKMLISGIGRGTSPDFFQKYNSMSDKDKNKLNQCINCKNLGKCNRDMTNEEDGLCKFYERIEYKQPKPFYKILEEVEKKERQYA